MASSKKKRKSSMPLGHNFSNMPDILDNSFKSTGGVTRDPFYLFDISAAAEFSRDTSKISAFELKFSSFLLFFFF
jgi:hypothetical protein